jgi:hypothetical protein
MLRRKLSASTESTLASCLVVSGGGNGILRLGAPAAGSRSIQGEQHRAAALWQRQ